MSLRPRQMNVVVDEEILDKVSKIAQHFGISSRSDVVRQAICRWYYTDIEPRLKRANGGRQVGRPRSRLR